MESFKTADLWLACWLSLKGVNYSDYEVLKGRTKITFTYEMPESEWKALRREFAQNQDISVFRREMQKLKDLGYKGE